MKYSFHYGLNKVTPKYYAGWDGLLAACCNDAANTQMMATLAGFQSWAEYDEAVTKDRIRQTLTDAQNYNSSDLFLMSISCHGGDENGAQSMCLTDGELWDSEFHNRFAKLKCNSVFIFDSCHSGGIAREYDPFCRVKAMPKVVADKLSRNNVTEIKDDVQGNVLILAACRTDQFANDGTKNGVWTACLVESFSNFLAEKKAFSWGNWFDASSAICSVKNPYQTPQLVMLGPSPETLLHAPVMDFSSPITPISDLL